MHSKGVQLNAKSPARVYAAPIELSVFGSTQRVLQISLHYKASSRTPADRRERSVSTVRSMPVKGSRPKQVQRTSTSSGCLNYFCQKIFNLSSTENVAVSMLLNFLNLFFSPQQAAVNAVTTGSRAIHSLRLRVIQLDTLARMSDTLLDAPYMRHTSTLLILPS